jgi:SAM-dependent methyltransferase
MVEENLERVKFSTNKEYKCWVESTDWYQTIHLKNGIVTPGKVPTNKRIAELEKVNFTAKRVLDIGCNSGQYCLLAKQKGAAQVMGIDINPKRIHQAKVLAANEELEVDFRVGGIDIVPNLGQFDIVICIAVLTEVENVLGGLRILREAISGRAIIEMGLAKPIAYLSRNIRWLRADKTVSRRGRVGEFQRHKHAGWVIYPSFEIVKDVFGGEFCVEHKGSGLRYDVIHIQKNSTNFNK